MANGFLYRRGNFRVVGITIFIPKISSFFLNKDYIGFNFRVVIGRTIIL